MQAPKSSQTSVPVPVAHKSGSDFLRASGWFMCTLFRGITRFFCTAVHDPLNLSPMR